MPNKIIIFLDGVSAGKTGVVETLKNKEYWVWNINFRNILSMISHKLFWNGNRNENYYKFIEELESLSAKYFNSEEIYLNMMVEKFLQNEKPQILIVHNGKESHFKEISKNTKNVYSILISEDEIVNSFYTKIFNVKDENFLEKTIDYIKNLIGENKNE